jgi:hypothetical protein
MPTCANGHSTFRSTCSQICIGLCRLTGCLRRKWHCRVNRRRFCSKHAYPAGSRMLKVHENARTSILIFKKFPGVTSPDPRNEGEGILAIAILKTWRRSWLQIIFFSHQKNNNSTLITMEKKLTKHCNQLTMILYDVSRPGTSSERSDFLPSSESCIILCSSVYSLVLFQETLSNNCGATEWRTGSRLATLDDLCSLLAV